MKTIFPVVDVLANGQAVSNQYDETLSNTPICSQYL